MTHDPMSNLTSLATRRFQLVLVTGTAVSDLQSDKLPTSLGWGQGYGSPNVALAAQTVHDAHGVPAGLYLVVLRDQVIGHVAFHAERSKPDVIWISYEVSASFRNQQVASESVSAVTDALLTIAKVIRAEVMRGHSASTTVLSRAGFTKTHEFRAGDVWERCQDGPR